MPHELRTQIFTHAAMPIIITASMDNFFFLLSNVRFHDFVSKVQSVDCGDINRLEAVFSLFTGNLVVDIRTMQRYVPTFQYY